MRKPSSKHRQRWASSAVIQRPMKKSSTASQERLKVHASSWDVTPEAHATFQQNDELLQQQFSMLVSPDEWTSEENDLFAALPYLNTSQETRSIGDSRRDLMQTPSPLKNVGVSSLQLARDDKNQYTTPKMISPPLQDMTFVHGVRGQVVSGNVLTTPTQTVTSGFLLPTSGHVQHFASPQFPKLEALMHQDLLQQTPPPMRGSISWNLSPLVTLSPFDRLLRASQTILPSTPRKFTPDLELLEQFQPRRIISSEARFGPVTKLAS